MAGRRASFTMHGSDHSDFVYVRRAATFLADLGGGSDYVTLYPDSPRNGRIDGGPGRNWLYARAKDSAVGDLARDRLTLTSDTAAPPRGVFRASGSSRPPADGSIYAARRRATS